MMTTRWQFLLTPALIAALAACGGSDDPGTTTDLDAGDVGDSTGGDTTGPDTTDPDAGDPDVTDPDVTDPDVTDPDGTDPDVTDPDGTDPDVTDPDGTDPDVTDPDVVDPDAIDPDAVDPDVVDPDAIDPDVVDPDVVDPDVVDPDVVDPDVVDPDVVDPDVVDPDPCEGIVSPCDDEAAGTACIDDVAYTCFLDGDGCPDWSTIDCAAAGQTCGDVAGEFACIEDGPSCPASLGTIACGDTVSGNTGDGTALYDTNSCFLTEDPEDASYPGNEVVYRFETGETPLLVAFVADASNTGADFDLTVSDGAGSCAPDADTCVDGSYSYGNQEVVELLAEPGSSFWLTYDVFDDILTSPYEISVFCLPNVCGDGEVVPTEACDDGNSDDGDGCSSTCEIEEGFTCADGEEGSECRELNVCGDGFTDSPEACDDANAESGDGCSDTCEIEDGFTCTDGEPTVCVPTGCGDGVTQEELGEECDDGNAESGDGCDAFCVIESGYLCEGEPSDCYEPGCGDGRIQSEFGEECDDGGEENGDGCSSLCTVEDGWFCTGEPSNCALPFALPTSAEESLEFVGSLSNDDAFIQRPSADCGSGFTDVPYRLYGLVNDSETPQGFTATVGSDFDGYLHVYDSVPDPDSPTDGCVIGNDDQAVPGFPNGSFLSIDFVEPGEIVYVMVSSFSEGRGDFTLEIDWIAPPAFLRSFSGEFTDDTPTFNRPFSDCSPRDSTPVPYEVFEVTNDTGGDLSLTVTGSWSFDGFLFVYDVPLDLDDPAEGCVSGNDDFGGLSGSRVAGVSFADGETLYIVASTFGATARGAFTVRAEGAPAE